MAELPRGIVDRQLEQFLHTIFGLTAGSDGEQTRSMFSVESWPEPAARVWVIAQRFQKFLMVGAVGLAVNQGLLFLSHDVFSFALAVASPLAIFMSMIVTFSLNERWTWHDRGTGPVLHRMGMYFPINMVGLVINYLILSLLVNEFTVHYLVANLFGAGVAAVWNFVVNHHVTWRASPA